ncbi:hypothetical protein CRUP_018345 [Coryphaenoides rupestris]|nr:hypothetical protein CRUP_018345 [Coryphaenoides rupestris]
MSTTTMATVAASWYHHDISRVQAEELLARAGRDGSYLVRASESVAGAYALCLLFQCHVHTYRILPDSEGLLAVQTMQGVQVNCFRTLEELVMGYQHPHKGLVTPLQFPVSRVAEPGDESSDDEKPAPAQASLNSTASSSPDPARTASHLLFLNKLQELNTSRKGTRISPSVFPRPVFTLAVLTWLTRPSCSAFTSTTSRMFQRDCTATCRTRSQQDSQ